MRCIIGVLVCVALALHVQATLVGNWKFEANQNGNDVAGNFPNFSLQGNANFEPEGLRVRGTGTASTGWAHAGGYQGPTVHSHNTGYTLASCVTLKSIGSVKAGAVVSMDRVSIDHFDAIVFDEYTTERWSIGSSSGLRNQAFNPGFQETTPDQRVFVAITSKTNGFIDGYRNEFHMGGYHAPVQKSWNSGDAEAFFGMRHGSSPTTGPGALDAVIHESWIFNNALDTSTLAAMSQACVVTPTLDPAVTEFCDDIAGKCTAMDAECTSIRNGQGPVIGAGTMPNTAGNGGVGHATGNVVLTGNSVVVTATGIISCSGNSCPNTPDGSTTPAHATMVLPGVNQHSLIARIGAGPWQFVGAGPTTLTGNGALTFAFNDGVTSFGDNNGSWFITIRSDITNVADDCDASVAVCNDMHQDCLTKVQSCPLV